MKANYNLIKILREAANYIEENPDKYSWYNCNSCNCGIVAKVAFNATPEQQSGFSWTTLAYIYKEKKTLLNQQFYLDILERYFCKQSKLTFKEAVEKLLGLGFDIEDFYRLEFLGGDDDKCNEPTHVVNWLHKEANRLEQQLNKQKDCLPQTVTL